MTIQKPKKIQTTTLTVKYQELSDAASRNQNKTENEYRQNNFEMKFEKSKFKLSMK